MVPAAEKFGAFPRAEAQSLPEFRWVVNGPPPGRDSFPGASTAEAAVERVILLDPGRRWSGAPRCYLLGHLCVDKISLPHKSLPHAQR